MCLFPPTSWILAIKIFAYKDAAVATSKAMTPPTQPRGTITAPEYPSTYALLMPVVRTNPACNHESTKFKTEVNNLEKRYHSMLFEP